MTLVKSKQRVADHGEVFTPAWMVDAMLNLVQAETERIDARFLEPACGSGNFLVPILRRKLAAVDAKYGKVEFERRHYALLALMCCYGIELLADNVAECRANLLAAFAGHMGLPDGDPCRQAAAHVLAVNIVPGDALEMRTHGGEPLTFAEWAYIGKGRFKRRDFRFDRLTHAALFNAEDSLFSQGGKHDLFSPTKDWPQMTLVELAAAFTENA